MDITSDHDKGQGFRELDMTAPAESWRCSKCKHVHIVAISRAVELFEKGCSFCGSDELALYDLSRELECR